jgi:hypothetical protein
MQTQPDRVASTISVYTTTDPICLSGRVASVQSFTYAGVQTGVRLTRVGWRRKVCDGMQHNGSASSRVAINWPFSDCLKPVKVEL